MKTTLRTIIALISLGFSAYAAEPPYRFEYTVTYENGTKTQGAALFLVSGVLVIPIQLNVFDICTLEFSGEMPDSKLENYWGGFTIYQNLSANEASAKSIFRSCMPVKLGKEIDLFKAMGNTVSVKISLPEAQKN